MSYRLAIFDFDGTLADSAWYFLKVINEIADEFRFRRIEEGNYEMIRGCDSAEIMKFLEVPMWKLPRIVRRMRARIAEENVPIRLFPGVDRMLRDLAQANISPAVVSSNSEENIRRILGPKNAGLIQHFGCGASLFGKTAKLKNTTKRCGVAPGEAIYIGDEIRDATAARAAKMDFGAVAWGYTTIKALRKEKPAIVFETVEDIVPAIIR